MHLILPLELLISVKLLIIQVFIRFCPAHQVLMILNLAEMTLCAEKPEHIGNFLFLEPLFRFIYSISTLTMASLWENYEK
jgi:hypothetical protein